MKFKEVKKGDLIINSKVLYAGPWYVAGKWNGYVMIKRRKKARLVALAPGQLRQFKLYERDKS